MKKIAWNKSKPDFASFLLSSDDFFLTALTEHLSRFLLWVYIIFQAAPFRVLTFLIFTTEHSQRVPPSGVSVNLYRPLLFWNFPQTSKRLIPST